MSLDLATVRPLLIAFACDLQGCSRAEGESLVSEFWDAYPVCIETGVHEWTAESKPLCRWCKSKLVEEYAG